MNTFNKFSAELNKTTPLQIKYKNNSEFMKILGAILFFNKNFMTSFITTIGSIIYFPTEEFVAGNETSSIILLAHEYVHVRDAVKYNKILFSLAYMSPQILSILFFILGFFWWPLFIIAGICLLPVSSPFRMYFELRGYKMSLFMENELLKNLGIDEDARKKYLINAANSFNRKYFVSSAYYYMWIFGVISYLSSTVDKIISGDIMTEKDSYYQDVLNCYNNVKDI